ncbi:MAG: helix-turn-helix transcriptional regulator [Leptolyngbyaceae cyanobacterium SM1_4_3]|nr:helix-turn-helix transcriptional regulator [Leptolyngbyaceae cyanobacterium SM1_4_3]
MAGKYESHVQETFSVLASRKELSARELADRLKISLNAASTRLKTIADLGLAKRVDLRDAQGKQYIYHPLV